MPMCPSVPLSPAACFFVFFKGRLFFGVLFALLRALACFIPSCPGPAVVQVLQKTSTPPSPSPAKRHRLPGCTSRYAKSRSSRTSRTSTGGRRLGARSKQAQLAEANGSMFDMLLILVAQMSTHPRVIAACYCCWGSTKFKLTHGALTAFEDLGVVAVALPRRARRCFSARLRRPPTRHRNCGRLPCQSATR